MKKIVTFKSPKKAQISQKLSEFYVKSRENRQKLAISQNRGNFGKNRVRFLQKYCHRLTLQNRGIGDKSRSLATLIILLVTNPEGNNFILARGIDH